MHLPRDPDPALPEEIERSVAAEHREHHVVRKGLFPLALPFPFPLEHDLARADLLHPRGARPASIRSARSPRRAPPWARSSRAPSEPSAPRPAPPSRRRSLGDRPRASWHAGRCRSASPWGNSRGWKKAPPLRESRIEVLAFAPRPPPPSPRLRLRRSRGRGSPPAPHAPRDLFPGRPRRPLPWPPSRGRI